MPIPRMRDKSPTLFTINAFKFALIADSLVYQKPISRYDITPTASQPKNNCRKLFDITRLNIEKVNRLMYEKNR